MKPVYKIKVGSQNDSDKKYLVQFFDDGSSMCECKDWEFRSKGNLLYFCKHIKRAIRHKIKNEKRTKEKN